MKPTLILIAALTFGTVGVSRASITIVWKNRGGDVVASYAGTLDLTGYVPATFDVDWTDVRLGPSENVFRGNVPVGDSTRLTMHFDAYVDSGLTVPNRNGTFYGGEQAFGFYADRSSFSSDLYVPPGYVSGSQIEGEAVFANTTVLETFGADVFDMKVFDDGLNSVTFASIPEPSSALLLFCGLSVALAGRRTVGNRKSLAFGLTWVWSGRQASNQAANLGYQLAPNA
jgi:hypothetical protein